MSTSKTVVRHIWQKYLDEAELIRHTEYHQRYYRLRSLTIERVFADAKEKHGIRYTRRKGRKRVQDEILLVFACMNLKKMALWMAKPSPQKETSDNLDSINPLKLLYLQLINKMKNGVFQPRWLKYPILSIVWSRQSCLLFSMPDILYRNLTRNCLSVDQRNSVHKPASFL